MIYGLYRRFIERIEQKLAHERAECIRLFCQLNELPYPEVVETLPSYSNEVGDCIRKHAMQDLPQTQFQGRVNKNSKACDLVEISGVMGFNGNLFEIAYKKPDLTFLEVMLVEDKRLASGVDLGIPIDEALRADELIHFHSHPFGSRDFSEGDLSNMRNMLSSFECKQYFLLYTPRLDKIDWYEVRN